MSAYANELIKSIEESAAERTAHMDALASILKQVEICTDGEGWGPKELELMMRECAYQGWDSRAWSSMLALVIGAMDHTIKFGALSYNTKDETGMIIRMMVHLFIVKGSQIGKMIGKTAAGDGKNFMTFLYQRLGVQNRIPAGITSVYACTLARTAACVPNYMITSYAACATAKMLVTREDMRLSKTIPDKAARALCCGFIHGCFSQSHIDYGAGSIALVHSLLLDRVINNARGRERTSIEDAWRFISAAITADSLPEHCKADALIECGINNYIIIEAIGASEILLLKMMDGDNVKLDEMIEDMKKTRVLDNDKRRPNELVYLKAVDMAKQYIKSFVRQ